MRQLAIPMLFVLAGAQPALGSSLVASALALGIRADAHAHSVALKSDGNHIDVVLSHGERDHHDGGEAPRDHDHPLGVFEDNHVIHITAGNVANATARRALPVSNPSLTASLPLPIAAAPPWAPTRSRPPHAHGVDLLRTVVLRL
jgi:hypothetical protein